jgi:plastocyanin
MEGQNTMRDQCRTWLAGAALVSCLVAAACGTGDDMPGTPTAPTPPASGNFILDIAEINGPNSFYPSPASVDAGRPLIWRNSHTETHRIVFDNIAVDTGRLAPGTVSQPLAVAPGRWMYHCSIHPEMVGELTVTAPSSTPAPAPGY